MTGPVHTENDSMHSVLQALLEKEYASATTLYAILESERDALAKNQLTQLNELASRKQEQALELEKLGKQRIDHLQSVGVPASNQGMDEYFADSDAVLKEDWEKLLSQLDACQQQNRVNGSIVEQLQRKTKNALSILQGRSDDTDLYGRSGKTVSDSKTNILTRA